VRDAERFALEDGVSAAAVDSAMSSGPVIPRTPVHMAWIHKSLESSYGSSCELHTIAIRAATHVFVASASLSVHHSG